MRVGTRLGYTDYIIKEKTVLLQKKDNEGFGFVLRGAKVHPTPAFPALQYLESVDEGGVAWRAGLRMGDFLIEVNGQNVVKVGHRQVVNMIRQGGNSLVVKVVMVTRHPEAPEGPRRRAAPPQPRRLPAPAISLRSKSMTSELEEMVEKVSPWKKRSEYDPSSATEKKRTVYQMALNKLDEILAAAQQSISAGEGPGAPLPPLGKTRPKGFFSPEAPFEAHRMGPGGFDRPFLPPGPPHGLMLRQKSIGAPEEDKPFLAPPSGKFSRSLSVPGSDDIPPPPTTSPPEPPYSTPPAPLGAATPRGGGRGGGLGAFTTWPAGGGLGGDTPGPPPRPPPRRGWSCGCASPRRGGCWPCPPPAPSVDGDEELLLAEPLPPPLEFANSFEGPEGPPVGDSTASSLTSYDSEVATLTQGVPESRRGGGGGAGGPEGPEVVTDSGIEEVDSRSSSDHPPEGGEGPPPYAPLAEGGGERARARGRGGPRGGEGRRSEAWEEAGRGIGGIASAWPRAAAEGPFGGDRAGAPGRHRLPDAAAPPPPTAKPPSAAAAALFPNWPPPKSGLGTLGGAGGELDVRPPLRRAPSPATLPSERRASPAPRPASLPTLPAAPLYAGFLELRGGPGGFGELPPSRSLSPTRPPPPDKPFGAKPLAFWSKFDVADWLEYLNLGEHRARFLHNEIDGSHLPALTKEDYIDLGVTRVGHRMNIDRALKLFLER
ncbi:LOW QUALITY PROTEIN: SH3 and multiple ankyrin repeat domains protein 1 [Falco rusticolus]|uniref:LOW QUALITY PROTEIN: SH3 and multiple ankyrin repeat domains protein 1 n=1 Tax=Falco rusticolus TaxID=120794 RepID=UPI0018866D26|nr:LOW QUALITY PROTEIN: SH3 and multiple ankyrin repeat domains protein 1 [Falco rusticolus]